MFPNIFHHLDPRQVPSIMGIVCPESWMARHQHHKQKQVRKDERVHECK